MSSPDDALLSLVGQTIRKHRLFQPDDIVVVAISGGADSTALLDLLGRLPGYNLRLIAAHLNHGLRGEESDADQEFCRCLAARYAIPYESGRMDVRSLADTCGLNLEDAGRRARISFLDELREKYRSQAVALAHHADDQAETFLMRLLRGAGTAGLSGMAYRNERGYVRPLLDATRAEIEQYLRRRGIGWREDTSNGDTTYLRNRIRHDLLPLLETYNPAIRASLVATASVLGGDEALLTEFTEQACALSCGMVQGELVSSIGQLRTFNPALRKRVLRLAFKQLTGTLTEVGQRHIEALCDMIDADRPNARLSLPHGVTAVREYDRLIWRQGNDDTAPFETGFELPIPEPGCYQIPSGGVITVEAAGMLPAQTDSVTVSVDLDKNPFPWLVRTFRTGDRMTPFGMSGRKKVKDIFIDRKIPLSGRKRIPLLFCGDDLIWIAGICASESCRIDARCAAAVRVTWRA